MGVIWWVLGIVGLLLSYSIILYTVTYCAVVYKVVLMQKVDYNKKNKGKNGKRRDPPSKIILTINPNQERKKKLLWAFILNQLGVLGMNGNQKVIKKVLIRIGMYDKAKMEWNKKKKRIMEIKKRKKNQKNQTCHCHHHHGPAGCKCNRENAKKKWRVTKTTTVSVS